MKNKNIQTEKKDTPSDKILIAGLCGIGDFLFFVPALRALRKEYKNIELDSLIFPNGLESLLRGSGLIDKFVLFPYEKYHYKEDKLKRKKRGGYIIDLIRVIISIRRKKYDIIIWPFAFTTPKKIMLNLLFGARLSILHEPEKKICKILCRKSCVWINQDQSLHCVEMNSMLLEPLGLSCDNESICLSIPDEKKKWAKKYLQEIRGKENRFIMGIQPGGKLLWNSNRQWSPEKYAKTADVISKKYAAITLLFGTKGERNILDRTAGMMHTEVLIVDNMSLSEVAAVIENLDFFIGNDSALIHLAAALKVKTLSVTGPTNYSRTGPWGESSYVIRKDIDCSPCFDRTQAMGCDSRRCLEELEPDDVVRASEGIIERDGKKESGELSPEVFNY